MVVGRPGLWAVTEVGAGIGAEIGAGAGSGAGGAGYGAGPGAVAVAGVGTAGDIWAGFVAGGIGLAAES